MKILLVGEYSRLHNSLKEGLQKNGHQVTLIGSGDFFKKYPVDVNIDSSLVKNNFLLNTLRHIIFKITAIDIAAIETYIKCIHHLRKLKGNDVVQLINERPFNIHYYLEKKLLHFIFKHNKNVFLSACGDDYTYISYSLSGKFPYSTLSPLLNNNALKPIYKNTLRRISKKQKKIHEFVFKHIIAVIPASVEYQLAYQNIPKAVHMIPNAVNIDTIKFTPSLVDGKIKILHGINSANYYKKGNNYFEEALTSIQKKYGPQIEINTLRDLPYEEYISYFLSAHIVLDQAQAHDQGYNALEAMAMGKVVFTGAGTYFKEHYKLTKQVAINATPDSQKIVDDLEILICNPDNIIQISKNARAFIEKEHHYIAIAKQYENTWNKHQKT